MAKKIGRTELHLHEVPGFAIDEIVNCGLHCIEGETKTYYPDIDSGRYKLPRFDSHYANKYLYEIGYADWDVEKEPISAWEYNPILLQLACSMFWDYLEAVRKHGVDPETLLDANGFYHALPEFEPPHGESPDFCIAM